MGWEDLVLADLSGEFDASQRAGRMAEAADVVEAEAATRSLASRWRQMAGARLSLTLLDGDEVAGEVLEANDNWLLLAEGPRRALVPADAVALVRGLGRSGPEAGGVVDRLSFASALRRIAEESATVRVGDAAGGAPHERCGVAARLSLHGVRGRRSLGTRGVRLGVPPLDVRLQLGDLHAPRALPADLDAAELPGGEQRTDLRHRDAELVGDVGDLEETRGHGSSIARSSRSVLTGVDMCRIRPVRAGACG
jgi:hypothetical protein